MLTASCDVSIYKYTDAIIFRWKVSKVTLSYGGYRIRAKGSKTVAQEESKQGN